MFATDSIEEVYIIKFCSRGFVLIADIIFFFYEKYVLKNLEWIIPNNIVFIFLKIIFQLQNLLVGDYFCYRSVNK